MFNKMKQFALTLFAILAIAIVAPAQMQQQKVTLSIHGYPGRATIVELQGRIFVDVQDFARITNGTLKYDKNVIVLALPSREASDVTEGLAGPLTFSRTFNKAAIESMAAIREWGGMLMITVQNGYPVGNNMAGNTILAYQDRAADTVALAASVASTDADHRGLELLQNEFSNLKTWASNYIEARRSLNAASLTISESALQNDEDAQKTIRCGQFLAQMFASGAFQEDPACR